MHAAVAWLKEDRSRRVAVGDALDVIQESYRIKMARLRGDD